MLVEAAWAASKTPGPLRAFNERIKARRGVQIAVVATARKLAVLCWHLVVKDEDYAFARPSLTTKKRRALELRAGLPSRRGQKGKAAAYSLKEVRRRENELAAQAEQAYRQLVADWQAKKPAKTHGRGRRQRGATLKALCGASCAAGLIAPDPALRSGSTTPTAQPNATKPLTNASPSRRGPRDRENGRSRAGRPRNEAAGSDLRPSGAPARPTACPKSVNPDGTAP